MTQELVVNGVHLTDPGLINAVEKAAFAIASGLIPDTFVVKPENVPTPIGTSGRDADKYRAEQAPILTRNRAAMAIMRGAELGLDWMTSLSTIMVVNNRTAVWGDGAIGLALKAKVLVDQTTEWSGTRLSDEWTCVVKLWRAGVSTPFEGRFVYRTAKAARLLVKRPWIDYPERMMFNRARAFAVRDGFADCLLGLAIMEEVHDIPEEPTAKAERIDSTGGFLDDGPAGIAGNGTAQLAHQPGETVDMPPAREKEPVPAGAAQQAAQEPAARQETTESSASPETPAEAPPAEDIAQEPASAPPAEPRENVNPPTVQEPKPPKTSRGIADYSAALIAWARIAPWEELQRHLQANAKQIEFIKANRVPDWDALALIIDGRRP